uniref:Uncharacterized protein n=1 Tax=Rhizophora mucronata TaxID=61149 RepID=A0A2P2P295_RHIMU
MFWFRGFLNCPTKSEKNNLLLFEVLVLEKGYVRVSNIRSAGMSGGLFLIR